MMAVTFNEFCGIGNETFTAWTGSDFGPCFELLVLVCPANALLAVSSAYFGAKRLHGSIRELPSSLATKLRIASSLLVCIEGLIEMVCSLVLERTRVPAYFLTCALLSFAWLLNSCALWNIRHLHLLRACMPRMHLVAVIVAILGTVLQFSSVIIGLQDNDWEASDLGVKEVGVLIRLFVQITFLLSLIPCQAWEGSVYDYRTAASSVQVPEFPDNEHTFLRSISQATFYSSIECVSDELGIAEKTSNFLSRLSFWWVGPMMLKGSKGRIQNPEDVFMLPPSLSTASLKEKFSWLFYCQDSQPAQNFGDQPSCLSDSQSDYSVQFTADRRERRHKSPSSAQTSSQRTLLGTLHQAFGWQYYSVGILKLLADALGFAGPLLLHALVSFMENSKEPMRHGYYYAAGLFASVFCGAITSSQFNFWVNKVGLKVRAAIITTVYHKALAVSSTTLSRFSTGEVVNFMSTDTDRVVNFCPSFHQFWSLPLQIGVSLYLLHQQVGVSFLAGLGFAVLLVPVNKWLAIKIQKLSKDMMMQKDARVKVMNETLHGIRVIKFYAWEKNFEEQINTLRAAELKSLKGRKYLDAWCVYFWATTPVVISILTFSTYVLLGNTLTAAKVFTSVALFNMLITPLNAFPWVLNGLMEAWVSVQRIQAFLSLEDFDPTGYYLQGPPTEMSSSDSGASELLIRNGHFTWKPGNEGENQKTEEGEREKKRVGAVAATVGCLSDINLRVTQGQLIGVIGKVGSGKSSLLSAIAAEMSKLNGEVFVANLQNGFGLAAQEPWIQHGTLKENILFGKAFDVDKYYGTIRACALEEDIRVLPAGDDTEIGENGVTLSGGQKARVALARAVYQDSPLYLLDDPLAAVDAHVAEHLFRHCIMGTLQKKTRILCTHHTKFLAAADVVLVMDQGTVVHCGPPRDVLQLSSVVGQISDSVSQQKGREQGDQGGGDESATQGEEGGLVKEEEKEVGVVRLHVYAAYWLAIGHCLATSILISLLLMQASRNVSDWWLAYWISHSKLQASPANSTGAAFAASWAAHIKIVRDSVTFYLLVYGALAVSNSVFTLFRAFLFAYGGVRAAKGLHTSLLRSILAAPVSFFDVTPIGRIINRFSSDIYSIDDSLPFILNIFLAQAYGVAGTVVITCYGLPWIVLLLLPLTLIYYYIQKYYRTTSRELKRLMSVTLSPVYAHFSETLTGLGTIRALRASERFADENQAKLDVNQRANYCAMVASQWLGLRLQFLGVAMVTGVAFLAVLEHHLSTVDPGLVGLAISYALSVTDRLSGMVTSFTETEKQMVGVERAVQYIEGVPSENKQPARVPEVWPFSGRISFVNVSLTYRPGLPPALCNVTFTTAPGEKIGIVGRTGSGKSSLFLVLFRIVEIERPGRVLLDGVYVDSAPLDVLRSRLAIIPQDAFLFSGSVRVNLDPWGKYSDADLWAVLEKCHLDGPVQELGGLDADVGERGRHFSVGQRQLVCLARALLTRAKVLCIDEATASVDLETDRLIQRTIRSEFNDSTVLTIAHRLDTIMDSDRVLVMNQGTVAEFDRPADLLRNEHSLFRSLVHSGKR